MKNFSDEEIEKIFQMYQNSHVLKTTLRTGWLYWGLDKKIRHESIAEHIYGCLMLATAIFANTNKINDVDVGRVFLMLALHETEEIFIGDITPYDEKVKDKKKLGREAVLKFFEGAKNKDFFLNVIEEFEEKTTNEAKFAYMIEKLEADIQAKFYDEHFGVEKVNENVSNSENILNYKQDGYTKVSDFFRLFDMAKYDDEFCEIAECLENKDFEQTKEESEK